MNVYLDTAISLVLIIMLFSVITYVLQELIAANLKYRSKMLWKSIAQLLDGYVGHVGLNKALPVSDDAPNTTALFSHPQIKVLQENLSRLPSYIPAANFALAILDNIGTSPTLGSFTTLQNNITEKADGSNFYKILKTLSDTSKDVQDLQAKIEDWYNRYMDRVTGWYQSETIVTIRLIAIAVTLFFNLNIIGLARDIAINSQLRNKLVTYSEFLVDHPDQINKFNGVSKSSVDSSISQHNWKKASGFIHDLDSLSVPIGWKQDWKKQFVNADNAVDIGKTTLVVLGWLIAAGCLSMGAPFWFNLLIKLVNTRRAGIKPGSKKNKRQ